MAKSIQSAEDKRVLKALADLGSQRVHDDELEFKGSKVILPATWDAAEGIKYLTKYREMMDEVHAFSRTFNYRPWDGAAAVQRGFKRVFGTAGIQQATYSFFGKRPPQLITINTSLTETMQVPWGKVQVPLFNGIMYLGSEDHPELGALFQLQVHAPRKFSAHVEGLFQIVQHELEENSIYRGKGIDGAESPEFLDLSSVRREDVVYTDDVEVQLEANVWSMMRHSLEFRNMGIPLKRSVLLEGPYGSGKTLAAFLTAQVAVENEWTFLYCRPTKDDLNQVMQTARLYQPAVVFFEDVDTVGKPGQGASQLLDTFDGITAKGTELLAILTTNHPEKIHKGMVRPGRLDSVIHIGALDNPGVEKLVKSTVSADNLSADIDYTEVAESMEGYLPAFIKEAVDRAQRYSIATNGGRLGVLETDHLVGAANGLRAQLALMEGAHDEEHRSSLEDEFRRLVRPEVESAVAGATLHDLDQERTTHEVHIDGNGGS